MAAPRSGGLSAQLLEQALHEVLPLNQEMPEVVLLGSGDLSFQGGEVVGKEVPQDHGLLVREDEGHSHTLRS